MKHQAGQMILFAGNSNPSLAEKISKSIALPLGNLSVGPVQGWRSFVSDPRERARCRCLHRPVDLLPGQ